MQEYRLDFRQKVRRNVSIGNERKRNTKIKMNSQFQS